MSKDATIEKTKAQKRGHDLLTDNFPAVSSHIQLGTELRSNFGRLERTLAELEGQIDATDEEVRSFRLLTMMADGRHHSSRLFCRC